MGPLPQTPTDIIVALTLTPYMPDQVTMCNMCVHVDKVAAEVFSRVKPLLEWTISNGGHCLVSQMHQGKAYKEGRPTGNDRIPDGMIHCTRVPNIQ